MRSVLGVLLAAQIGAAPAFAEEAQEIVVEPLDAPPPAQPAPAQAEYPGPPAPRDDVLVDIHTGDAAAGLEPAQFGAGRCLAPCQKPFPRDGYYRITGEGIVESKAFQLPASGRQVTLNVNTGSKTVETTGAVLGVGGFVVIGGVALYSLKEALGNIDTPVSKTTQEVTAYGMLAGLGIVVLGGILYFRSYTSVRSKGGALRFGPAVTLIPTR
jgi:hypothetical protein